MSITIVYCHLNCNHKEKQTSPPLLLLRLAKYSQLSCITSSSSSSSSMNIQNSLVGMCKYQVQSFLFCIFILFLSIKFIAVTMYIDWPYISYHIKHKILIRFQKPQNSKLWYFNCSCCYSFRFIWFSRSIEMQLIVKGLNKLNSKLNEIVCLTVCLLTKPNCMFNILLYWLNF